MPTIEGFRNQQSSGRVEEANIKPGQYGGVYESIAKVGEAVASISADFMERKKRIEDAEAVSGQITKNMEDVARRKEEIRKEHLETMDDGTIQFDPRGKQLYSSDGIERRTKSYTEKIKEMNLEIIKNGEKSMPSSNSLASYKLQSEDMLRRSILESINTEQVETANVLLKNKERNVNRATDLLFRNPSISALEASVNNLNEYYKAVGPDLSANGDLASDMQSSRRSLVHNGYLRGILEQSPETGLAVLGFDSKGKPVKGPTRPVKGSEIVTKNMTKDDLADWYGKFMSKVKEKNDHTSKLLNDKLNDIKSAALNGRTDTSLGEVRGIVEQMGSLGHFSNNEEKVRRYSDVASAIVAGESMKTMATKSNNEIFADSVNSGKSIARLNDTVSSLARKSGVNLYKEFADADRTELLSAIGSSANKLVELRREDGATAVMYGSEALSNSARITQEGLGPDRATNQAYTSSLISEQRRVGAVERPLSVSTAAAYAEKIMSSGPGESSDVIDSIKKSNPRHFQRIWAQVVKDGKLPAIYNAASYVDDSAAGKEIIGAMRNWKGIDGLIKSTKDQGFKIDKDGLNNSVNKELSDYLVSMANSEEIAGSANIANSVREAAYFAAARRVMGGDSISDASSKAVDAVIRNKYEVVNGTLIPRDKSEEIKKKMAYLTSESFIRANKPYIPATVGSEPGNFETTRDRFVSGFGFVYENVKPGIKEDREKRIINALKNPYFHEWTLDPGGMSATLRIKIKQPNGDYKKYPVAAEKFDKSGNPIEPEPIRIDWSE